MQEDLSRLARELRQEKCPQRAIAAAMQRIAAETPQPSRLRIAIPVAFGAIVLLCGLLIPPRNSSQFTLRLGQQAHGSTQEVASQTESALDLIGTVLLDAGARSGTVISDRAMPALLNGFDTAKNKIIDHTKL